MTQTLDERKAALLEQLMGIDGARRGQLSKQYYTHRGADGRVSKQGPYYVWQRYVKGKKCSVRISSDRIRRVEAELQQGREVERILDELWTVLEQSAGEPDVGRKKKPGRSNPCANVKPKPPLG